MGFVDAFGQRLFEELDYDFWMATSRGKGSEHGSSFPSFLFFPRKQAVLFQMSWNVLFFDFRLIRSTSWHRCEACDGDFGFSLISFAEWFGVMMYIGANWLWYPTTGGGGFLWNSSSEKLKFQATA